MSRYRERSVLVFALFLAACSSDQGSGKKSAVAGNAGEENATRGGGGANAAGASNGGNAAEGGAVTSTGGVTASGGSSGSAASGGSGGVGGTTTSAVLCNSYGQACGVGSDCCSSLCDLVSGSCVSTVNTCSIPGASCSNATECCNLACVGGKCAADRCVSDGQACENGEQCCSQNCSSGTCAALNVACKTAGNGCSGNTECCSGFCADGHCAIGSSYCVQTGDICAHGGDCCTGVCNLASGSTVGTCGEPTATAANCTGVEGTLCNDCGSCCSRLCAPFGPTGVKICQPASGCRVVGELCTSNLDCCGGDPDSNLPGAGQVTCDIASGAIVGRCRNATGCAPQGAVCHYLNYPLCDISSARNACCAGTGNSGVCQLDTLGVPRCNGMGTTCRAEGEECASADDCCNDIPCIRATDGKLRCYTTTTGDPSCVSEGGSCTINGDCCPGTTCLRALGSTSGICGVYEPPSGTGGATGSGGATAAGGSTSTTNSVCGEYGQVCSNGSDCCNAVPCTLGLCKFPIN